MLKRFFISIILGSMPILTSCSNNQIAESEPDTQNPPLHEEKEIDIPSKNTLGVLLHKNKSYDGYTLFTVYKDTYLIDLCGRVINHWVSDYERGGAFALLGDGSLLRAGKINNENVSYAGLGGIIEKFDWDGTLSWQYTYSSSQFSQHHGLAQLPNGNILILAAHRKTFEEAIKAGRNPETLTEGELYDEQIIEIMPVGATGGDIVWQWNAWDHLVQDFDHTKDNYGSIADSPQRIDVNFLGTSDGKKDWLHFNSIQYNENLDQIIISSQKLSEIYIIDHSTNTLEAASSSGGVSGKGGDLLYRWGNSIVYGNGSTETRQLYGQHNPYWIPEQYPDGGKILIFNNGLGRDSKYSSLEIIDPKINTEGNYTYTSEMGYGPKTSEWTYVNKENPLLFYSRILSNAQRLPNGNTLVCEGTSGKFFELDPEGEIVWIYINPITSDGTVLVQKDTPSSNVYQVIRYGSDYSGLMGKNLSPDDPIELDFDIGNCQ